MTCVTFDNYLRASKDKLKSQNTIFKRMYACISRNIKNPRLNLAHVIQLRSHLLTWNTDNYRNWKIVCDVIIYVTTRTTTGAYFIELNRKHAVSHGQT